MDNVGEVEVGDLNLIDVCVKELEEVVCHGGLVGVLHTNTELVGIGRRQVERERVVIAHGLDELEEVDHIHTENVLGRAVVVLKTVIIQTQINEDGVSFIYRHHLDAACVKLQICLRENLLECFYERTKGSSLNSANLEQVSICVSLGAHLMAGVVPSLSN